VPPTIGQLYAERRATLRSPRAAQPRAAQPRDDAGRGTRPEEERGNLAI